MEDLLRFILKFLAHFWKKYAYILTFAGWVAGWLDGLLAVGVRSGKLRKLETSGFFALVPCYKVSGSTLYKRSRIAFRV